MKAPLGHVVSPPRPGARDVPADPPLHLAPAPDRQVFDPATAQLLPAEGSRVPNNSFWRRRLRDADVVDLDAAALHPNKGA